MHGSQHAPHDRPVRRRRSRRRRALATVGLVGLAAATVAGPGTAPAGAETAVVADVTVGIAPIGVTVGRDGDVWVANDFTEDVSRVDPATNSVSATIPMTGSALAAATGLDGDIWITEGAASSSDVARIDPATNTVLGRVPLDDSTPGSIAVGLDGDLWIVDQGPTPRVYRVDPDRGAFGEVVATLSFPAAVSTVATGQDGFLWVNGGAGDTHLSRIDPATGAVVTSTMPDATASVAVGHDGDLWLTVPDLTDSSFLRLRPRPDGTTTTVATVPVGLQNLWPITVGADGTIWAAAQVPGPPADLVRVDPAGGPAGTGAVLDRVTTEGSSQSGLATGLDGSIWASSFDTQQVFRVAVTTDLTGTISLAPSTVPVGGLSTVTLSITTTDPHNAAVDTVAELRFPDGVSLGYTGQCVPDAGGARCDLGQVGPGTTEVEIPVFGNVVGSYPVEARLRWANQEAQGLVTGQVRLTVVPGPTPTPPPTPVRPVVVTPHFTG